MSIASSTFKKACDWPIVIIQVPTMQLNRKLFLKCASLAIVFVNWRGCTLYSRNRPQWPNICQVWCAFFVQLVRGCWLPFTDIFIMQFIIYLVVFVAFCCNAGMLRSFRTTRKRVSICFYWFWSIFLSLLFDKRSLMTVSSPNAASKLSWE